ncbi:conserved hypothetical protein [Ixodes scapularis]|uniref:Uncharacterized protein n=1 Tax=Ixodes scapularis TaxID=6945 RepID=B7QDP1_IXOSC|nr:conserved hypothetical protein [Ixodes scapularis]|eukprot:XP_002413655.1 conserved hypothetical protein [Ixodes scapularis]
MAVTECVVAGVPALGPAWEEVLVTAEVWKGWALGILVAVVETEILTGPEVVVPKAGGDRERVPVETPHRLQMEVTVLALKVLSRGMAEESCPELGVVEQVLELAVGHVKGEVQVRVTVPLETVGGGVQDQVLAEGIQESLLGAEDVMVWLSLCQGMVEGVDPVVGVVEQGQVLVLEVLVVGMDEVVAVGSVFGVVKVEEDLETVASGLDQGVVVQEIWVDSVSEVGAPEKVSVHLEDVEELKERNPVGVAWVEVVGQEGVEVVVTVGMTGVEALVGKVEVVVEEGKVQGRVERVSEYLFVVLLVLAVVVEEMETADRVLRVAPE